MRGRARGEGGRQAAAPRPSGFWRRATQAVLSTARASDPPASNAGQSWPADSAGVERSWWWALRVMSDIWPSEFDAGGPTRMCSTNQESRGTAAAVLFAAQWIAARDPRATVVFLPSDHFIQEEGVFMEQVSDAARFVKRQPKWIVPLGVPPGEPETEYGWIEPGAATGGRDRPGAPLPDPAVSGETVEGGCANTVRAWMSVEHPCLCGRGLVRCWQPDVSVCRACRSDLLASRPSGGVNTKDGRFVRRTHSRGRWTLAGHSGGVRTAPGGPESAWSLRGAIS